MHGGVCRLHNTRSHFPTPDTAITAPGFTIWSFASVVGAEVLKIRIWVCFSSKNHQPLHHSFAKCGPQATCSPIRSRKTLISWSPTLESEQVGVWLQSLHFPQALQVAPAFGAQEFETSGAPPLAGRGTAPRSPPPALTQTEGTQPGGLERPNLVCAPAPRELSARFWPAPSAQRPARMRARAPRLSSRRAFRCPGYR